jgi:hypothetical protein
VIVIAFATLLYVRRPGMMSFAFWLYALTSVSTDTLLPLFRYVPPALGVVIFLPLVGIVGGAFAIPLIPFALRFPDGKLTGWQRWTDAAV